MSLRKLQGALLRGTESLRVAARRRSSARAKEEARTRWAWERAELLDVLEARVKQLQVSNISEIMVRNVQETPSQSTLWKVAAPAWKKHASKHEGRSSSHPSRWMEKLSKEKSLKHKRLLRLEAKLSATDPRTNPTRKGGKVVVREEESPPKYSAEGSPKGPAKYQASKKTKGRLPCMATVQVSPGPEPSGDSPSPAEGLAVQVPGWEDAKEKLPLEEEEGSRTGNIRLSILAYLDCCLFLGQIERAQQCLNFYHRSHSRRKLLDVQMYNQLMHGYAKKGALSQVGQLFHQLEEAGLKPNLESYVAALECMGRSSVRPQVIARLSANGSLLDELDSALQTVYSHGRARTA